MKWDLRNGVGFTKYLHFGFDLEHYLLSENEILSI